MFRLVLIIWLLPICASAVQMTVTHHCYDDENGGKLVYSGPLTCEEWKAQQTQQYCYRYLGNKMSVFIAPPQGCKTNSAAKAFRDFQIQAMKSGYKGLFKCVQRDGTTKIEQAPCADDLTVGMEFIKTNGTKENFTPHGQGYTSTRWQGATGTRQTSAVEALKKDASANCVFKHKDVSAWDWETELNSTMRKIDKNNLNFIRDFYKWEHAMIYKLEVWQSFTRQDHEQRIKYIRTIEGTASKQAKKNAINSLKALWRKIQKGISPGQLAEKARLQRMTSTCINKRNNARQQLARLQKVNNRQTHVQPTVHVREARPQATENRSVVRVQKVAYREQPVAPLTVRAPVEKPTDAMQSFSSPFWGTPTGTMIIILFSLVCGVLLTVILKLRGDIAERERALKQDRIEPVVGD